MGKLQAALDELYRLEINCGLKSFWDGGWEVWLGDDLNGLIAEASFNAEPGVLDDIAIWLLKQAEYYIRRNHIAPVALKDNGAGHG